MTDEAAQSREAAGSSQDAPAPSAVPPPAPAPSPPATDLPPAYEPPAAGAPPVADPPPPPGATPPPGAAPPPGATPPPPGGTPPPGAQPPPWFGAPESGPTFVRERLIRPTRGRYVAGVSGAIANATNTDPVLWRVLLAVLGFFGGIGVLVYLAGWLLIPAEGDTASPIESLLGRGRSTMAPLSIVLLGTAAVLTFTFIVQDGFRATLLAAAVLVCGGLLLKRGSRANASTQPSAPPAAAPPGAASGPAQADAWSAATTPGPASFPQATYPPTATPAAPAEPTTTPFPAAAAPAGEPVTAPLPPTPPNYTQGAYVPPSTAYAPPRPPEFGPPTSGYRPPFAPHGPWAQGANRPAPPPAPPRPPKPPKPRRERSKLGRITFFMIVVVMGLLAMIDVSGVDVTVSAYFAAALATIGLGLVVGAWFGRARGLIALALLACLGLGISSGAETWGGELGNSSYRPQSIGAVADRYDFTIGTATLDLRAVDFTGKEQTTTVAMKVGQIKILLPDNVDTTTTVQMDGGRARIFGTEWEGQDLGTQELTDLGPDGAGGGSLRLNVELNTGDLEVTR